MIVTDTILVGYTMVSGTWGVQLALLVSSLFNYFVSPNPSIPRLPIITEAQYQVEMEEL